MAPSNLPYLDGDTVHRLAPYDLLVQALHDGHLEPEPAVRRVVYAPEGRDEMFLGLPAWAPDEAIGVKLVTVFPDNLAKGKPSVQAVYVLFDGEDGKPLCAMDGTALTYRKTSCDSALGSRFLSRPDARTLLMVGAGGMARHLIAAHRVVRPSLQTVLVWNRTRERAQQLAAAVGGEVAGDLDQAVSEADIISSATMTQEPLIKGEMIRPGTHLDLVGAYLPDHREVDDEVIRRAKIYVDSHLAAVEESGDLVIPLNTGLITHDDIRGDLYALCQGRVDGRSNPSDITVFENGGGGHLDLMTARYVWRSFSD